MTLTITQYELSLPLYVNLTWECDDAAVAYYKLYKGFHQEDLPLLAMTTNTSYSDISIFKNRVTEDLIIKIEAYDIGDTLLEEVVERITSNELANYLKYRRWFEHNFNKSLNAGGHNIAVLKRRKYGTACTAGCVHSVTGESTNPRCEICYGTGYVGGYHTPVVLKALFGPFQIYASERGTENHFEVENSTMICYPYPHMVRGDVIVDLDTLDRYQVLGNSPKFFRYNSTKLGTIYYEVRKLTHQDPAYLVDIATTVTEVSDVVYDDGAGTASVQGQMLRPRYGATYLVIWYTDDDGERQESVYYADSIKKINDSEIVFNIGTDHDMITYQYSYRVVSNNRYFDGDF